MSNKNTDIKLKDIIAFNINCLYRILSPKYNKNQFLRVKCGMSLESLKLIIKMKESSFNYWATSSRGPKIFFITLILSSQIGSHKIMVLVAVVVVGRKLTFLDFFFNKIHSTSNIQLNYFQRGKAQKFRIIIHLSFQKV